MKIEVGESLACSYLRHVKHCWLVQANWKAPGPWGRRQTDAELEDLFSGMKERFDCDGAVFKQTNAAQFLKQGEIDVVGVELQGDVHAMEVAFHEAGLQYGSKAETNSRVLKKMLRIIYVLNAHRPPKTALHAYFLSPKVNPEVATLLGETFAELRGEYPDVAWHLLINADCTESVIRPTLENASSVADSSELFLRSAKLLETASYSLAPSDAVARTRSRRPKPEVGIQDLVKALMRTILVDCPTLLSSTEKGELQDEAHCRKSLGLQISSGLIREKELGREINGHSRYWKELFGDFYVCSQWWREHHRANAQVLLSFVEELAQTRRDHADVLRPHAQKFRDYLAVS